MITSAAFRRCAAAALVISNADSAFTVPGSSHVDCTSASASTLQGCSSTLGDATSATPPFTLSWTYDGCLLSDPVAASQWGVVAECVVLAVGGGVCSSNTTAPLPVAAEGSVVAHCGPCCGASCTRVVSSSLAYSGANASTTAACAASLEWTWRDNHKGPYFQEPYGIPAWVAGAAAGAIAIFCMTGIGCAIRWDVSRQAKVADAETAAKAEGEGEGNPHPDEVVDAAEEAYGAGVGNLEPGQRRTSLA
jgi:hypothetical protein